MNLSLSLILFYTTVALYNLFIRFCGYDVFSALSFSLALFCKTLRVNCTLCVCACPLPVVLMGPHDVLFMVLFFSWPLFLRLKVKHVFCSPYAIAFPSPIFIWRATIAACVNFRQICADLAEIHSKEILIGLVL